MALVRLITFALASILCGAFVSAPVRANAAGADPVDINLIDINHASQAELRTLPGIGEAWSLAIIKHRPYKNKAQLRSRGVIPTAAYNRIRDKIIAKQ